jgi:hypothetical protein
MKTSTCGGIIVFAVALLAPQIIRAQGTMTYLSNLAQASAGSLAVGSNSWFVAPFRTGTNASGYVLNSIQLEMTVASGNPSNFTAMLYGNGTYPGGNSLGSSLGTLDGSLNPIAGGIFTYTPASTLTLSPNTFYSIVLTAGTAIANGAYDWSYAGVNSYSPSGGWASDIKVLTSSDGSSWRIIVGDYPQYAINAIPIPEPGVLGLFGVGGLGFLWHRRKAKMV